MKILTTFHLSILLLLVGCGDPAIDATSKESMEHSVQEVRESLPLERRPEFDEAFKLLAFNKVQMDDLLVESAGGAGIMQSKMKEALHGKTAQQIIDEAAVILKQRQEELDRTEREAKEKADAAERAAGLALIDHLEKEKAAAEESARQLSRVKVLKSNFLMTYKGYSRTRAVIEMEIENQTSFPLARIDFQATLRVPGKSTPWCSDKFYYEFPGLVAPGERASFSWPQKPRTLWESVPNHREASLSVSMLGIRGFDGYPHYTATSFGNDKLKELTELKEKYESQ